MDRIGLYVSSPLFWEGIINRYRESVFHQLITYFSDRYFSVRFHTYEHIPLGPSADQSAQMIILAAVIALILASVIVTVTRSREGRLVKKLLEGACFSTEKAKTLAELGEFRSTLLRRALSRGGHLSGCVYCAFEEVEKNLCEETDGSTEAAEEASGDENPSLKVPTEGEKGSAAEETEEQKELRMHEKNRLKGGRKLDFTTARFYIPEALKYRAEVRYEKRGHGWLTVALTVVISLVGAALICRFLPDFIQLLDNVLALSAPQ